MRMNPKLQQIAGLTLETQAAQTPGHGGSCRGPCQIGFSGARGNAEFRRVSSRDQMPLHAIARCGRDDRQESLPRTDSARDANVFAQFQPDGERNDTSAETIGGQDQREAESSDEIERSATQTHHVDTGSPSGQRAGSTRAQNAISGSLALRPSQRAAGERVSDTSSTLFP